MAIVREQIKTAQGTGSQSGVAIAFDNAITAGSTLLMAISSYVAGGSSYTVTDNNGNTWIEVFDNNYSGSDVAGIAYVQNANSGATTVTVTTNGTNDFYTIVLIEISGAIPVQVLDQSSEATATGTIWDSGNITTTQDYEYLLGVMAVDNGDLTLTEDAAWDLVYEEETGSTQMPISVSEIFTTETITDSYSGVIQSSSPYWAGVVAFKAVETLTPTVLDTATSTVNSTTIQSGSITPSPNALLIAVIYARTSAGTRPVTGVADTLTGTGSWTIDVQTVGTSSGFANIAICTAKAGINPGTGTVTATLENNSARKIMHVLEVKGYKYATPIVQSASGTSAASTLSFTLPASPGSTSCVIGAINQSSDTATAITPGTNYVELIETSGGFGAGNIIAQVQYDIKPNSTTVDWSNLHTNNNAGVAIEIALAPVSHAVTRAAARSGTGTQDFIYPGFGTPKGAIFIWTNATADGTAAAHAEIGIGVTDGSTEVCDYCVSLDNLDQANARRGTNNAALISTWTAAAGLDGLAVFVDFIQDGIRINWTSAETNATLITCVLFGGPDLSVKAGEFIQPAGDANTVDVNVTFEPDQVICINSGTSSNNSTDAHLSVGFADNGDSIVQAAHTWTNKLGSQTGDPAGVIVNNRVIVNHQRSAALISRSSEITAFNPGPTTPPPGFTSTTRDTTQSVANTVTYFALAYNGAVSHDVVFIDTPTSTGNNSVSGLGYRPGFVLELISKHTTYGTSTINDTAGIKGLSAFTADEAYCNSVASEDAADITNTQSISNDQVIDADDDDGTALFAATLVSMDAGGWTRNFSATDTGTVRKWAAMVLGAELASGGPPDALAAREYPRGYARGVIRGSI